MQPETLKSELTDLLQSYGAIQEITAVAGGCISDAYRLKIIDEAGKQQDWFVKLNDLTYAENFACESQGLQALAATQTIAVPHSARQLQSRHACLIMKWIPPSRPTADYYCRLGQQLALMHQWDTGSDYGWQRDNYLGATKQLNPRSQNWPEFFAVQRLEFQLRLAQQQSLADTQLATDCRAIIQRIDDLLDGRTDRPSLIHGDLWSGNHLCDPHGNPVLIDPAVHFACREAEFGMIQLFGNCPPLFYEAYQDAWPMKPGWQRRVQVYVLYHLLNHLNLFGSGYLGQCRELARQILRS